jgi:2-dehydro-3-deoxyphosphogluconate aldolase/(4S)-4-hydroxy-2-oxoglutarate aldolase
MTHPLYEVLCDERLVAAIRAPSFEAGLKAAHAVADGGVRLLEITFTVPEATRVMRELRSRTDAIVGAGTVLTAAQAHAAIEAGARFIVAPNTSPEVAAVAREHKLLYIPGAFTTGEIIAAHAAGAHAIKVYPVGLIGPSYITVIRDPLPNIPMLAAGGINLENVVPFLKTGCVACGLGAALADSKLAAAGAYEEIKRRAQAFVARVREVPAARTLA